MYVSRPSILTVVPTLRFVEPLSFVTSVWAMSAGVCVALGVGAVRSARVLCTTVCFFESQTQTSLPLRMTSCSAKFVST